MAPGYRYRPFWSPDSKKIAFIDKAMRIKIFDITTNQTTEVDRALRYTHGNLEFFTVSWSPDSRWMAYARDLENQHNAIYMYDYTDKKNHPVTHGFYECNSPVFDPEGKYLYFFTNQSFKPDYSDIDNTFIYSNTTQVAVVSLKKETPSLLTPKNDTVATKTDDVAKEDKDKKKILHLQITRKQKLWR
jgi:tricorn protease